MRGPSRRALNENSPTSALSKLFVARDLFDWGLGLMIGL